MKLERSGGRAPSDNRWPWRNRRKSSGLTARMLLPFLLLTCQLWRCQPQMAAESPVPVRTLELSALNERHEINAGEAQVLIDPGATLSADDAASSPAWQDWPRPAVNLGLTSAAVWVRLRVAHHGNAPLTRLLLAENARLWELELYRVDHNRTAMLARSGASQDAATVSLAFPYYAFPLTLQPQESIELLLRAQHRTTLQLPLAIVPQSALLDGGRAFAWGYGLIFGALAALALYHLFIYLAVRDRNSILYVLIVVFMILFTAGFAGLTQRWLFLGQADLDSRFLPAIGALGLALVAFFTADYFHAASALPLGARLLHWIIAGLLLAAVLSMAGWVRAATGLAIVCSFVLAPASIWIALTRMRRGFRPARPYLIAWGVFFLATTLHGVMQLGGFTLLFWLQHGLAIGAVVSAALLSLGVGSRLRSQELERAEISAELSLAREIQLALLPVQLPDQELLAVAYHYEPMHLIGGDLVDVHLRGDRALFIVADVSGHGVPAALLSTAIKAALPPCYELAADPAALLTRLHRGVLDRMAGRHFTACVASFSVQDGALTVAAAGAPPPMLLSRDGDVVELEALGPVIHPQIDPIWENQRFQLQSGDRILMYTDGVVEAENEYGDRFREERLVSLLERCGALSPDQVCERILRELRHFVGFERGLQDDVTLMCFERRRTSLD
ncbi:MAG: SpoIIE family protein phosphatase [Leptospirales bacterium]|nr:SpoIIE family protein phosphatase [Leptospirales bacterium]